MRHLLRLHKMFRDDYHAAKRAVQEPERLDAELKKIAAMLRQNQNLPPRYVSNLLLVEGIGWHECFVYSDKKTVIILQYKIEEHCTVLTRIGSPETLTEKRKFFTEPP